MLRNRLYVGEMAHRGQIYPGQHVALLDRAIFDRAQQMLADNRVKRKLGGGAADPSLLEGLLRDGHDRRMSPSHYCKGNRRYRYYISRTDGNAADMPVWRVSAGDLESQVVRLLSTMLVDAQAALIVRASLSADQLQSLQASVASAMQRLQGTGRALRDLLVALVSQVTLRDDRLLVAARFDAIDPAFGETKIESGVPISCVRSGRQHKLILPPVQLNQEGNRSPSLIKLVTQAIAAREVLESTPATDIDALSAAMGYGRDHASDLLRISWLAPDIIQAILNGRQPDGLTRTKLIRWTALPLDWQEQRRVLGFA